MKERRGKNMIKLKLLKTLVISMCVSVLSTGVAFAAENSESLKENPTLVEDNGADLPVDSSIYEMAITNDTDSDLLKKQEEIDRYIFKDHADELLEMGFKATYTGPNEDLIEIGITPFNDEYAAYLYDIFGTDTIKVIDSEEAQIYASEPSDKLETPESKEGEDRYVGDDIVLEDGEMGIVSVGDDAEIVDPEATDKMAESTVVDTTSADSTEKDFSTMIIILSVLGGLVILAGVIILSRKKMVK
jgi:hypothetical protein